MDLGKFKDFAKTAVDKTADSINKANETRKKAAMETKITVAAGSSFGTDTTIRKTLMGEYYIGMYSEDAPKYTFESFRFEASTIIEKTETKGKTTQKGRTGSVLGGAALGSVIFPGVGTVVGAMAGGARKKKGTIASTSITTQEEKPGNATIILRSVDTGELKNIKTKLTNAQAENVERFFN